MDSVPRLGRSPREGNSYPLQCSGLENSMDRGAWWATVHGFTESDTTRRLSLLSRYPLILLHKFHLLISYVALVVKNPPANAGDERDEDLIHGWGRSPREGNGNLLQYSCLGNLMNRRAWRATVHGVAKSWIWLSDWELIHVDFLY